MQPSLASRIQTANSMLIVDGNLGLIGDFFTPDYVVHLTDQDRAGGHQAVEQYLRMIRHAFPDVQVEVEILLEGEDRVAWQRTLRGTHRNGFYGFPANDQPLTWRDMVTSHFRDGLIAEEWVISDLAERLLLVRKG